VPSLAPYRPRPLRASPVAPLHAPAKILDAEKIRLKDSESTNGDGSTLANVQSASAKSWALTTCVAVQECRFGSNPERFSTRKSGPLYLNKPTFARPNR